MPFRDNAKEWDRYARTTGDDSFAQFMMYWIGFNFLYSDYKRGERDSEKLQIERLCEARFNDLERYDPFAEDTEIHVFLEHPIGKGVSSSYRQPRQLRNEGGHLPPRRMTPRQLWEVVRSGNGLERVQCLFITLYQVRCNLFHGSKSPYDENDLALMRASAHIMRRYMDVLLEE